MIFPPYYPTDSCLLVRYNVFGFGGSSGTLAILATFPPLGFTSRAVVRAPVSGWPSCKPKKRGQGCSEFLLEDSDKVSWSREKSDEDEVHISDLVSSLLIYSSNYCVLLGANVRLVS